MKELRAPDELRMLAPHLLAHLGRDDGWRIEPGAWVLGNWRFTPMRARRQSRSRSAPEGRAPMDDRMNWRIP
jgi:hypothetical protein